jgi:AcrR family transcriptional regulator
VSDAHLPTRERILKQALQLFAARGYDATSVREICEAVGVTKPTLYHFFGSKEGLYRILVDGSLAQLQEQITLAMGEPGTVREQLAGVARLFFATARSRPNLVRLVYHLAHSPTTTTPLTDFVRFHQEVNTLVHHSIEAGIARGELAPGPVALRALIFMGGLQESLVGHVYTGEPELTDGFAENLVENILSGWRHS